MSCKPNLCQTYYFYKVTNKKHIGIYTCFKCTALIIDKVLHPENDLCNLTNTVQSCISLITSPYTYCMEE